MKNPYNTLRSNASLTSLATAAILDANKLRRQLNTFRDTLTAGALLSFEDRQTLTALSEQWEKAADIAKHLNRLSK